MSNDFEVMPVGTIAEVTAMRKFVGDLLAATEVQTGNDSLVLQNLLCKIAEVRKFYADHAERYPVTV